MNNETISIIIVHHNTPERLQTLLETLVQDTHFEIIVIDNASKVFSSIIQKKYPSVQIIENQINRGYAFACNQGVTIAKGEWVLFLNPDIEISSLAIHDWVIQTKEKKYVASSPHPLSGNYAKPVPSVLSLIAEFTPLKWILPLTFFTHKTLTGGALLIEKNMLKKMGGWDERFFIWFEDSDLTKRLLDKNIPYGFITIQYDHIGGDSFTTWNNNKKKTIFFHSMNVYAKKHFSWFGRFLILLLKNKYSRNKILPTLQEGTSITVPNMKKDLLNEFFQKNNKSYIQFEEVVVVSNSIDTEELWTLRKKYNTVRFIPIELNNGFAQTVNIGLNTSTFKWTGTINDDVIIPENFLKILLSYSSEKTGSINPVIVSPSREVESAGITVLPKGKAVPITTIPSDEITNVDATNGAAVLYSHKALEHVGIFDEQFGSYLEDIDLSLRLKQKDYINSICTKIQVEHLKHATSSTVLKNKKAWLDFKNWLRVIYKNWGVTDIIRYSPQILLERLRNISGVIKSFSE